MGLKATPTHEAVHHFGRLSSSLIIPLSLMDNSSSEKIKSQGGDALPTNWEADRKESKSDGWPSSPTSVDVETTSVISTETDGAFPEGGRGWLVVLGCFIFASITVGWG